jgi:concentrative nucleoside transporter, CNT family
MNRYNLISAAGIFILMGIAWLLSPRKRLINRRLIAWGLALQAGFAFLIFRFPPGARVFYAVNEAVVAVMNTAGAGAEFLFGRLAVPLGGVSAAGEPSLGFFLAFQALPTIIFFSALMSILYHVGVMQKIIGAFSRVFSRLMTISGAESLCAASNIFVGVESSLTIRPYLETMTPSELTTVLTVGMATVASNVLALYIFSLNDVFPTIAGHLVSASILSAPAALIMSKLIMPETGDPVTRGITVTPHFTRDPSLMEAIINGANAGVKLIVGIVALLVAVLGIVALADLIIGSAGGWVNGVTGGTIDWTLTGLLGYVFLPVTYLLGVPAADAWIVARIIGERVLVTEVTAYRHLAEAIDSGMLVHGRSAVICAYALCGFAHVASLAIFIGGITAVAPATTHTLSRVGWRALVAATLACLMTGCIAGLMYTGKASFIM